MGGLYAREFAVKHQNQVAGLVLVEAVTPELMEIPQVQAFFGHFLTAARANAALAPLGLTKPAYFFLSDRIGLPAEAAREKRAALTSGRQARAAVDEVRHWPDAARQASAAGAYDAALPIAVVTAAPNGAGRSVWEDARRLPADRSSAGSWAPPSTKPATPPSSASTTTPASSRPPCAWSLVRTPGPMLPKPSAERARSSMVRSRPLITVWLQVQSPAGPTTAFFG